MRVGFLISSQDCNHLLTYALSSVMCQNTSENICVYLCDDGSIVDQTKFIPEENPLNIPIRSIKNDRVMGLPYSLNKLIDLALRDGCNFMSRLDADEMAHPLRVEFCLKLFREQPDVDLIGYSPGVLSSVRIVGPLLCRVRECLSSSPLIHGSWFGKADFFRRKYDEDFLRCQDVELLVRGRVRRIALKSEELSVFSLRERGSRATLGFQIKLVRLRYPRLVAGFLEILIRLKWAINQR